MVNKLESIQWILFFENHIFVHSNLLESERKWGNDRQTDRQTDRMTEWQNDRMSECQNYRMTEC